MFIFESILLQNYTGIPIKFVSLILMGLALRYVLIITGQLWASNYSQTATFLLLPIITYVITTIIAGNIALSLGMVGALSIVRFRNPVRSSFELVMFFLLITLGIATAPKFHWAVILFLVTISVLLFIHFLNYYYKKYLNRSFYQISFSEGNELSILEIETNENQLRLNEDKDLIYYNYENGIYIYRLATNDNNKLINIKNNLNNNKSIKKVNLNLLK